MSSKAHVKLGLAIVFFIYSLEGKEISFSFVDRVDTFCGPVQGMAVPVAGNTGSTLFYFSPVNDTLKKESTAGGSDYFHPLCAPGGRGRTLGRSTARL